MCRSLSLLVTVCFTSMGCVRTTLDIPPASDGASIVGTLVERDAATGELTPLPGARVEVLAEPYGVVSNDIGLFTLERLPLGRHVVQVRRQLRANGQATIVKVLGNLPLNTDGQSLNLGTIEVGEPGVLAGRVSLADSADPGAAEGTQVVVARTSYSAVVGRDGEWRLAGLPEGEFEVVAYRSGYAPARLRRVVVSSGEERRVTALVLTPGGSGAVAVVGQVSLQGEADASGVEVRFFDESRTSTETGVAMSEASGRYALELPVASHRARFSKPGYRTVWLRGIAVLPEAVLGLVPVTLAREVPGDQDADGVGDATDEDRDGDGCPNDVDAFPDDATGCADADGDRVADDHDADDDGDLLGDAEERSAGRDGWVTDPLAVDTDGDGLPDNRDLCPTIADPAQADADGDRIGDACDEDSEVETPPGTNEAALSVTGFVPASGGAGTRVVIRGQGFRTDRAELNVVSFGRGVAVATQATARDIMVEVPPNADSGAIRVFNGRESSTSTASFTVHPAPAIDSFSPARATIGAHVTVYGAGFGVPGLRVQVGGVVARAAVLAAQNGLERLDVTVPDAPTGLIRVETLGGATSSVRALEVLGPPSILRLTPNPLPPGAELGIGGIGFTAASASDITVEFAGGVTAQAARLTSDTYFSVVVPANAATGPIRVRHAQWSSTSSDPVQIDPQLPAIRRVFPMVPSPGDQVRLDGVNFHAPPSRTLVSVTFGGVPTSTVVLGDTVLLATVPPNARPGPIVVTTRLSDGRQPTTQTQPLWHIHRTTGPQLREPRGLGFNATGDRLYAVESANWHIYRIPTFQLESTGPLTLPNFDPTRMVATGFQVSPSGTVGILTLGSGTEVSTRVVNVPGFSQIFDCGADAAVDGGRAARFSFDTRSSFAYSTTNRQTETEGFQGVWQIDFGRHQCSVLGRIATTEGLVNGVLALDGAEQVLVSHSGRGYAVLDSNPASTGFGSLVGGFVGRPDDHNVLFWDIQPQAVVSCGGVNCDRLAELGARPDGFIPGSSTGPDIAQTVDHRWLFFAGTDSEGRAAVLIDLAQGEVVRRGDRDIDAGRPAVALPTKPAFVAFASSRLMLLELVAP